MEKSIVISSYQYLSCVFVLVLILFPHSLFSQCVEPSANIWDNTWESCVPSDNPNPVRGTGHWIQYDLGSIRYISEVHVWNTNASDKLTNGFRNVIIDYSEDGVTWNSMGPYEFPQGTGAPTYGGFTAVNMTGNQARYVLITATSNWGGDCFGLAEVKFNLLLDLEAPDSACDEPPCTIACSPPAEIGLVEAGATSLLLFWEPVENAVAYVVTFRPVGTEEWEEIEVGEPEALLENLDPNTEYEVIVVTVCDGDESDPTELSYFTTENPTNTTAFNQVDQYRFQVFPNPANDRAFVSIRAQRPASAYLQIVDTKGQTVLHRRIPLQPGENQFPVSLQGLKNGVYLVSVGMEQDQMVLSRRLVVIR